MAFVPEDAPLVVLGFLGTGVLLALAGAGILVAWFTGRHRLAGWLLAAAVVVASGYGCLLLGFALTSEERTLEPDEWKYFCEIDCHTAYQMVEVTSAKTLGSQAAAGTFTVVTLKTWFDQRTISARRSKNRPLRPNPRALALVDDQGRVFEVSPAGQQGLEETRSEGTPLTAPLKPGESYTTRLAFDVPADARHLRLLVATEDELTYFLIGHENSFFHKKVYFRLEPAPPAAS